MPMYQDDSLSQFITSLSPQCECFAQVALTAPWGIEENRLKGCAFTFLQEGKCVVSIEGQETIHLQHRQLIILPHGSSHQKKSDEQARCQSADLLFEGKSHYEISQMRLGGGGEPTRLMCGYIDFSLAQHWGKDAQMGFVPEVMLLDVAQHSRLEKLIVWLEEELRLEIPGHKLASQRVLELILLEIMRQTLESDHPPSWLSGLNDRHISPVILYIQQHYANDLSLSQLANVSALSRSAFSDRFKEMTGLAPLKFVRQWRCFIGAKLLVNSHLNIEQIASKIGYQSADVFIRNFKQFHETTPKQYRQLGLNAGKKIDDLAAIADGSS